MRRRDLLALCMLGAFAATTLAAPQRVFADAAQAKVFERKGKSAYSKKRFEEAAAAFKLAYEAAPVPKYLFNAAKAYEQCNALAQAVDLLQRYVAAETDPVERADGQAQLQILRSRLGASHAQITLTSTPAGAQVLVEGAGPTRSGMTPWSMWLRVGAWKITMILADHKPFTQNIIAQAGRPTTITAQLSKPPPVVVAPVPVAGPAKTTGKLRVSTTEPAGAPAQLRIDGQDKGALPLEIDVEAGRHLIEVTRSGYRPWSKWLELKPGADRTIELVMARADAGGALPAAVGVAGVGMAAGGLALGAGGGGGGGGESSPGLSLGTGGSADARTAGGAPPAQPGAPRPAAAAAPQPAATAPAVAGKESLGERRKRTEGLGRLPTTTSLYSIAAFNSDVVVALRGTLPNEKDFEVELEESNDYTDYGVGFRFGDLLNPFVEVGASLHVWFGNTDVGTDTDVNRFILSPFMKLRVPVLPGPQGDLLEVYGLATGGLQIYAYTSDTTKDQEAAGDRLQEINFGWLVGAAAGAQLNLTRNLGLFAEGGVIRSRVSIGLSELRGQQVTEGEFVIDLLEPYASFGLVFLN